MAFSILCYILFGIWAIACFIYWGKLIKMARKYNTSLFYLKDALSEEDKIVMKKHRAQMLLIFIAVVVLIFVFFFVEINGNL